ncbi:unnamed protein product [Lactuca saligna]|uniref:Inositol polyphosphate-related phosphatase domain-containing protein n=1 Tax=Lactuca saligna TaxID=75948 RepID=A0AA35XZR1_LACSI|nr:unnamed protein product [Lactuca saligna]
MMNSSRPPVNGCNVVSSHQDRFWLESSNSEKDSRVRNCIRSNVGDVELAAFPCGFGNAIGNKGGVGFRMRICGQIICFVNCHFASHLDVGGWGAAKSFLLNHFFLTICLFWHSAGKSFVTKILMLRRVFSIRKVAILLVLPYVSICTEKVRVKLMEERNMKPLDSNLAALSARCSKDLELNLDKSFLSEMGQCTTTYPYNQLLGALVLKNYERQDATLLSWNLMYIVD